MKLCTLHSNQYPWLWGLRQLNEISNSTFLRRFEIASSLHFQRVNWFHEFKTDTFNPSFKILVLRFSESKLEFLSRVNGCVDKSDCRESLVRIEVLTLIKILTDVLIIKRQTFFDQISLLPLFFYLFFDVFTLTTSLIRAEIVLIWLNSMIFHHWTCLRSLFCVYIQSRQSFLIFHNHVLQLNQKKNFMKFDQFISIVTKIEEIWN